MFLVSVPLRRALEAQPSKGSDWANTVVISTDENLDGFRDLIRQPSKREPNEGITRIEVEPYLFNMYSFNGRVLGHHQTYVKADGYLACNVTNASLKYALSTELRNIGTFEMRYWPDSLFLSRKGLGVTIDVGHSQTFEDALRCYECEVEHSRFEVNTERLLDLCQGAIKVGCQHVEIVPHEGIARIVDTSQMQARGYQLPSEVEEKKVGLSVQVIDMPPWGEIDSLTIEAEDLIFPLKTLIEDEHVTLTVVGERGPDYTIVRGYEDFPRFGVRINTRIGG